MQVAGEIFLAFRPREEFLHDGGDPFLTDPDICLLAFGSPVPRLGKILPHAAGGQALQLSGQPVHGGVDGLHAEDMSGTNRQVPCGKFGIEEQVIVLVGEPVPAVIREDHDGPGPHPRVSPGPTLALNERRRIARSFVLEDCPDCGVVEPHLQRCGGDDDVRICVYPRVLRRGPADSQTFIRPQVVADPRA